MRPLLASLLTTLAVPDCSPEPAPTEESASCKCGQTVQAYRQVGEFARPIEDGELLWPGDRIQFCFTGLPEDGWLSIASRDSTETIGLTHRWSTAAAPGCAPLSVEADDTPGPERVWIPLHTDYPEAIPDRPGAATFAFTFPKMLPEP